MPSNPTRLARFAPFMGRGALTPVRSVQARIVARLDAQDAAARARGWTVEALPYGGRVYRDPRFDRLATNAADAASPGLEVCS